MKKNIVNNLFVDEYKRRNKIILYTIFISIFLIIFISSACTYFIKNKKEYITYTENSDISYRVYLKENDFFSKNYAEEKKQYIASLIDYINATFKYDIKMDQSNVDFKYFYRINAKVNVKERNGEKSLYEFEEAILPIKEGTIHDSSTINIQEDVKIDYNRYNDIINEFIRTYRLTDTESTLTISLSVETDSSCSDFDSDNNTESIVSLVIPLTTKTMAIDITNDLVDNDYKIILCNNNKTTVKYLIIAIISLIIDIIIITRLSMYIAKTRSAKDIYDKELKKILSNYHSFIQKVDNYLDLTNYEVVAINTFTDMLEIRDTINQPILMVENKSKNGVYFIIPSNTKILYTYSLKVKE